jgi:hypothetical protein
MPALYCNIPKSQRNKQPGSVKSRVQKEASFPMENVRVISNNYLNLHYNKTQTHHILHVINTHLEPK